MTPAGTLAGMIIAVLAVSWVLPRLEVAVTGRIARKGYARTIDDARRRIRHKVALTPVQGEALGILRAEAIGMEVPIVEGATEIVLAEGVGHYPTTPLPDEPGRCVVVGHNALYGGPFARLTELEPGDGITVELATGTVEYRVIHDELVSPDYVPELCGMRSPWERLTLVTGHPKHNPTMRYLVHADRVRVRAGVGS